MGNREAMGMGCVKVPHFVTPPCGVGCSDRLACEVLDVTRSSCATTIDVRRCEQR